MAASALLITRIQRLAIVAFVATALAKGSWPCCRIAGVQRGGSCVTTGIHGPMDTNRNQPVLTAVAVVSARIGTPLLGPRSGEDI